MLHDFMGETAILIGFIAFIGLLLQKKPFYQILEGTTKAILGYIILQFGAQLAIGYLSKFVVLFERTWDIDGIIPNDELLAGLSQWFYGKEIAYIMIVGVILHLLIARFTRIKYIFLTGHQILFMSSLLATSLGNTHISMFMQVIIGAAVLALSMSLFPALCQPMMNRVTGNHRVAMGHFGTIGFFAAGMVALVVGNHNRMSNRSIVGSHRMPERKAASGSFSFLRNPPVTMSLFMLALFFLLFLYAGKELVSEHSGSESVLIFVMMQSFQITAGLYIILIGVRMMLSEMMTAFNGIATRVVPEAIPALDSPVVFSYAPVAVMIGFIFSFTGSLMGMFLLLYFKINVVIPAVITHFISGGAAGVFSYKLGGLRGAIVGSFVHGLILTAVPLLLMPVMQRFGFVNTTYSETDLAFVGIILDYIFQYIDALFVRIF